MGCIVSINATFAKKEETAPAVSSFLILGDSNNLLRLSSGQLLAAGLDDGNSIVVPNFPALSK